MTAPRAAHAGYRPAIEEWIDANNEPTGVQFDEGGESSVDLAFGVRTWSCTPLALDTKHHLIVTHDVTNVGTDRSQLANVAKQTKDTLETGSLDVVADRGYFNSAEILAFAEASITVTLPKPMTSDAKADGRFGKAGLPLRGSPGCLHLSGG